MHSDKIHISDHNPTNGSVTKYVYVFIILDYLGPWRSTCPAKAESTQRAVDFIASFVSIDHNRAVRAALALLDMPSIVLKGMRLVCVRGQSRVHVSNTYCPDAIEQ